MIFSLNVGGKPGTLSHLGSRYPSTMRLRSELARSASLLVTMGCGEACPVVPALEREEWPLRDPKDQPRARVREIRDEVRQRVDELLRLRGWGRASSETPVGRG